MSSESDLLSSINSLRTDTSCNDCGTFQLCLKRLSSCTHLLCDDCHKLSGSCPVCNSKHRSKNIKNSEDINTILSHVNSLYQFINSIQNGGTTKISYLFISDSYNYKRHHNGETQLHKYCRAGNIASVSTLVESGMDVNVQDFASWTPLHEAVLNQRVGIVKLLLANGALVNVPGLDYLTPLHSAVLEKNDEIAKLLIQHGARCTAYNKDGKTPLDLCDSDDMRDAICMTNMLPSIVRTYVIPELRIFLNNVSKDISDRIGQLPGVTLMQKAHLLNFSNVKYFVIGNDKPNLMYLQAAMLQGAIICSMDFVGDLISKHSALNPMNYFADVPNYAISKAGLNSLNKLPKLFDGIHFYLVNISKKTVNDMEYTSEDIKTLIYLGGGKIDTRAPSGSNYTVSYPYHTCKTESNATVSCYLIYDEAKNLKRKTFPDQIKYQTVQWLINSINSFKILP
ncbi:hypothetical protein PPYR_01326 [Photinus pyralis]|uniref:BRCT domain-containing protein n=1 Tax=Photinus pyralis TaxID=7054 RepID=A0A5N4B464_PHOPY|nr:BRCA1-associated RING domain protein 1-like [Photinus pyralis]KAB0804356.1 hypothetical protein PPYR_01326 [Photinus pyralis]